MISEFKGIIGVCGGSSISSSVYKLAEEIGSIIAKKKYIVVCGGKGGTMEAICKGAKKSNGTTIGILPSKDSDEANDYVDIAIPTGLGEMRNSIIINTAQGIISIAGGAGTLNEIAYTWISKKPLVALKPSGGWSEKLAGFKIDSTRNDIIEVANTPLEAVEKIIDLIERTK